MTRLQKKKTMQMPITSQVLFFRSDGKTSEMPVITVSRSVNSESNPRVINMRKKRIAQNGGAGKVVIAWG